jgi:hypothetical protein
MYTVYIENAIIETKSAPYLGKGLINNILEYI